ncbi:MAG: YiiX/YebB-like N1pC/P60 family cysteine hydrolase [Akkermansiaceae bacterium]
MLKYLTLCLISLVSTLSAQWQNGDIIFTKTSGRQAIAVEAATESPWTHTAVIFINEGKPMVLEAVQPVQIISLEDYFKRSGAKSTHSFKRLKDTSTLNKDIFTRASAWAKKHVGKNYDGRFQWSDQTLYCSELVWKVYHECAGIELCRVKKVKEYNLEHPKVKQLITERFGSVNRLNLEEKIVAPSDIYDSELLVEFQPSKKRELIEK